jgi:hypothetical protein
VKPTLVRSLAIVFVLPILAHAHILLGYALSDPIYRFGNIGSAAAGRFPGGATIDPNYGFIDQALTTRAMALLLSGHLPWWNSLEGFGAPLAGEMQSSSLFPFSPLVLLPNGNLILNIVLAILAGIGMLVLLRVLGIDPWPALVGAILYEMCGTFSWLSGSWSYAIAWLPLLVLGIERCRSMDLRSIRLGVLLVAVSVALLMYSGFIETAYLEGLVGVSWAFARLFGIGIRVGIRYAAALCFGATLGFAIAAPIVVAFANTLAMSIVGMHDGSSPAGALPKTALLQKFVPYVYGPIFASRQADVSTIWGQTGGYVGFIVAALALTGLIGARYRAVRIALAITVVLGFSAMFGGPLQSLVLAIPGVKYTASYRYIDPAIAFAFSILTAFALDDVIVLQNIGGRIAIGLFGALGLVAVAFGFGAEDISGPAAAADLDLSGWHVFSFWELAIASFAVCAALVVRAARMRATILGFAACMEAFVFLVIPTLSNPTGATIALAGVRYLRQNVGLHRVYSLGPLAPNYGSYFGVASLSYNDLPVPKRTVAYIKEHLDPLADPITFLPIPRAGLSVSENFAQRFTAFERVGVKYVLSQPGDPTPVPSAVLKFRDSAMNIYELPNPAPYFRAPGCTIDATSRASVTSRCNAPSTLCRIELNAPGWTANLDGRTVVPTDCDEIFQGVRIPVGISHLSFMFSPPHERAAGYAASMALVVLLVLALSLVRGSSLRHADRPTF